MTYQSGADFRRALNQRLANRARETGLPLVRLQREVVFEALLARLQAVAPGRWLLKGGLSLELRLGVHARTTKDMDLARQDTETAATEDFIAAQALRTGDGFTFVIEKTRAAAETGAAGSAQFRVRADVAGTYFQNVVVDVGFGDPQPESVDIISTPGLLAFAGIQPVRVPAIPLTQHLAEKLHAYTRIYGSGPSSRVKDLVDMALIATFVTLEAGALQRAIDATFSLRALHAVPNELPPPDQKLAQPYQSLAHEVGLDEDIEKGWSVAAALLDPALRGTVPGNARWHPATQSWDV